MSDRKYGQQGYQDDDRGDERRRSGPSRSPAEPREKPLRPRGRGLGAPTATVFRCAACGQKHSAGVDVGSVCSKCGTDLHTCTHCAHFDTSALGECRKRAPVYVANKSKRNDCELYEPKAAQEFAKEPESARSGKSAFDALFKR